MKLKILNGCEASAEGAISAGCVFYAGYPITPQNRFPEYMSERMEQNGGIFIQAESETSSINMLFGAAAAGFRCMTSSSSPGISLMQEGISYLAGCELPAVIVNMARGGPGLGDVTPSQADYFQATRGGGHGDYRTIVLAPWSCQEIHEHTYIAFDLADKYRNPVLVLGDGLLAQMYETVRLKSKKKRFPKKPWALYGCSGRKPNSLKSLFLTPGVLEAHNWKLASKWARIEKREIRFESYYCKGSSYIVVSFGTCARIAKEAVEKARQEGINIGLFRPVTLWPFPYAHLAECVKDAKKILVVEMNLGQMVDDVKLSAKNSDARIFFYGRPGGGVPDPDEIYKEIKKK
ncbi:MAG: 3-methyl-2-oxobutanoate dehydrogenase subunit VorB [Candidatus Omnitrophica bacterium]|nr:3-methyl-2-oxobutanoate dehydrogenase subunit VorB [Candidatus Omnitrophota bacterium]